MGRQLVVVACTVCFTQIPSRFSTEFGVDSARGRGLAGASAPSALRYLLRPRRSFHALQLPHSAWRTPRIASSKRPIVSEPEPGSPSILKTLTRRPSASSAETEVRHGEERVVGHVRESRGPSSTQTPALTHARATVGFSADPRSPASPSIWSTPNGDSYTCVVYATVRSRQPFSVPRSIRCRKSRRVRTSPFISSDVIVGRRRVAHERERSRGSERRAPRGT